MPGYGERPLARAMEALMLEKPGYWSGYYHGDETALRIQRHFSYSDRIRYYWTQPEAEAAVGTLLSALEGVRIPETLLHQYLPNIPADIRTAADILVAAVDQVLAVYDSAAAAGG